MVVRRRGDDGPWDVERAGSLPDMTRTTASTWAHHYLPFLQASEHARVSQPTTAPPSRCSGFYRHTLDPQRLEDPETFAALPRPAVCGMTCADTPVVTTRYEETDGVFGTNLTLPVVVRRAGLPVVTA